MRSSRAWAGSWRGPWRPTPCCRPSSRRWPRRSSCPMPPSPCSEDGGVERRRGLGTPAGAAAPPAAGLPGRDRGRAGARPAARRGRFSAADRRLLEDLARQAGVAAYAGPPHRRSAALARAAGHGARGGAPPAAPRPARRPRPGARQHAAAGRNRARPAAQRAGESAALLAGLIEQLSTATADIRRLVYALRPPALDDLGLVRRHARPGAPVRHPALRDPPRSARARCRRCPRRSRWPCCGSPRKR